MGGIFVSYRREDARGQARALSDALSDRFGADRVFRDIDALAPGVDFPEAIADAVARSEVLLAVIGDKWLTAEKEGQRRLDNPEDYVRREIATALERNIRVIPVLLEAAMMPARAQLPPDLAELADRNAIRITDDTWDDAVKRLINAIEPPAGAGAKTKAKARTEGDEPDRRKLAVGAGVAVAAVVLIAVAAVVFAGGGDDGDGGDGRDTDVSRVTNITLGTVPDATLGGVRPTLGRVEVDLTLSPTSGAPGTRVTAQGTGFQADERVEIRFFTEIVARVRADSRGAFSGATFTVPDTPFRRGTEVFATGEQSLRTAQATFTVR